MRFLIVDTLYEGFLDWLYNQQNPGLAGRSFQEQYAAQVAGFFHSASAWAEPLRALGHEVLDISANNAAMQVRWMLEKGRIDSLRASADSLQFGSMHLRQQAPLGTWQRAIVAEQVRDFRPDVLLCANLYLFEDQFLESLKGFYGKAVGQHAAVMPQTSLNRFDLIISSLPNQVAAFRGRGIRAELLGLAFDARMLDRLQDRGKPHDVAFVGQVSAAHQGRARFLAAVAREMPLAFWGGAVWPADVDPATLRLIPHPPVWGLTMYQTLRDCRMVLNYHLDEAGPYANNLRLFEVTGVGSVLVTDNKLNIRDYFEPDREVVVFDSPAECLAKIRHLQNHPAEWEQIARAGQERTLRQHSYANRTGELLAMLG